MGKHEDLTGAANGAAPVEPAVPAATSTEPASMADLFGKGPSATEPVKTEPPKIGAPGIVPPSSSPPVETPQIATSERAMHDGIKSARAAAAATAPEIPAADQSDAPEKSGATPAAQSRFLMLAASLALAAGLGGMIGALGAFAISSANTPAVVMNDNSALREAMTQIRNEVTGLKSTLDTQTKSTNAQFARLDARFKSIEHAQTEPNTKLTKVMQSLERLEKREPAPITTGTVTPPAPAPAAVAPLPPQRPAIVQGWTIRDVYDGTAMIEGRRGEILEVSPGDMVPGIGRVDAIRRQDGRWVVVTPKGLIVAAARPRERNVDRD
jgi:hypothetical protein